MPLARKQRTRSTTKKEALKLLPASNGYDRVLPRTQYDNIPIILYHREACANIEKKSGKTISCQKMRVIKSNHRSKRKLGGLLVYSEDVCLHHHCQILWIKLSSYHHHCTGHSLIICLLRGFLFTLMPNFSNYHRIIIFVPAICSSFHPLSFGLPRHWAHAPWTSLPAGLRNEPGRTRRGRRWAAWDGSSSSRSSGKLPGARSWWMPVDACFFATCKRRRKFQWTGTTWPGKGMLPMVVNRKEEKKVFEIYFSSWSRSRIFNCACVLYGKTIVEKSLSEP